MYTFSPENKLLKQKQLNSKTALSFTEFLTELLWTISNFHSFCGDITGVGQKNWNTWFYYTI